MTEVYRVTHTISWAGRETRATSGDLVVDPPAFVTEQLGHHLERLDEGGRLPRPELESCRYQQLQQLAAAGDVEDVDGNSDAAGIIDAYALDEEAGDE